MLKKKLMSTVALSLVMFMACSCTKPGEKIIFSSYSHRPQRYAGTDESLRKKSDSFHASVKSESHDEKRRC